MGELTGSLSSGLALQEDGKLVDRLREREEEAFSEVFHLYRDLIYTLALKLLADRSEAMDVTQEVFLTLFRKVDQFRGECSLRTWLYKVALNRVANRNRWWRRRFFGRTESLSLGLKENGQPGLDLASDQPRPDRTLFSRELHGALQRALCALPIEQRAAVVLRDVQGLSYEEIGEVMRTEVGTVKSRIARGRERLKQALEKFREGARL
jgi:RNA polymerase sigma-70 factor (ECF subfamily)